MPEIAQYSTYSLFDFLLDPLFKEWVLRPNTQSDEYWNLVLQHHPQQRETIYKAIQIIQNRPAVDDQLLNERKQALWDKIDSATADQPKIIPIRTSRRSYLKYAAAVIVLLSIFGSIWLYKSTSEIYVATGNGQSKTIWLPDSSQVLLGPNSSLSYQKNFTEAQRREVWAKGDIKFNVKHLNQNPQQVKDGETFIVHLNNKIAVEVLGTVFTVNNRRGQTSVALLSGSVKVTKNQEQILLKPGQSVATNNQKALQLNAPVPQQIVRDWQEQMVTLNRTNVKQIITLMEDSYGIKLKVENTHILRKEIDGILPLNDQEKALQILTNITNTNLQEKEGVYLLKEVKP